MRTSKAIQVCLGLSAYTVALCAGLAVGNPASHTIFIALVAAVPGYALGALLGAVAEHVVSEFEAQYAARHPVVDVSEIETPVVSDVEIIEDAS